jgi:hypothetical protein
MHTQPTYQVPWSKLGEAQQDLDLLGLAEPFSHPILFLCGLKFTHSYFATAHQKLDPRASWYGAGHLVDDGLDEACRHGLKTLVTIAKSKSFRSSFDGLGLESKNLDWTFLKLAFVTLESKLSPAVQEWLRIGELRTNWIRLSFGMGVRSHWDANEYVIKVMKARFGFANQKEEDVSVKVGQVVDGFKWNPDWVLPEL